jgi:hypothetical protein
MSALAIRAHIHHLNQHYLCPLAQTGDTAQEMEKWIEAANNGTQPMQPIYIENEKGERKLLAEGYVFERTLQAEIPSAPDAASVQDEATGSVQTIQWTERVFVVRSESYRKSLLNGLEGRLQRATAKLIALTPPPARGKRQIQDEAELVKAATVILKQHAVEDLPPDIQLDGRGVRVLEMQRRVPGNRDDASAFGLHEILGPRRNMREPCHDVGPQPPAACLVAGKGILVHNKDLQPLQGKGPCRSSPRRAGTRAYRIIGGHGTPDCISTVVNKIAGDNYGSILVW